MSDGDALTACPGRGIDEALELGRPAWRASKAKNAKLRR